MFQRVINKLKVLKPKKVCVSSKRTQKTEVDSNKDADRLDEVNISERNGDELVKQLQAGHDRDVTSDREEDREKKRFGWRAFFRFFRGKAQKRSTEKRESEGEISGKIRDENGSATDHAAGQNAVFHSEKRDELKEVMKASVHDTFDSDPVPSCSRDIDKNLFEDLKADKTSTVLTTERKDQLEQETSQLVFYDALENLTDLDSLKESKELDNEGKVEKKERFKFLKLFKRTEDRLYRKTGDFNSHYDIGKMLGEGSFGSVYGGIRKSDGLNVALKYVDKETGMRHLSIQGYPEPLPSEIALMILVQKGPSIPQIIKLLEWYDEPKRYIMVLERPMPCVDFFDFVIEHGGKIDEKTARLVMRQVVLALCECFRRGVVHRDIKPENLIINTETMEVKLIDFGSGDLLKSSSYTDLAGSKMYVAPEVYQREYHAEPTTVWSLGIMMFAIMFGCFPDEDDLSYMNSKVWYDDTVSKECCDLINCLLQNEPKKRLRLKKILRHDWFKKLDNEVKVKIKEPEASKCFNLLKLFKRTEDRLYGKTGDFKSHYDIGEMLGQGGFGSVYAGIRKSDGLNVALKFVAKETGMRHLSIHGYPEPLPIEIALMILVQKGSSIPQIIKLLEWYDEPKRYIMVLERPMPSLDFFDFGTEHGGAIDEKTARLVMRQVVQATCECFRRGVVHRDIKLENLIINTETMEVKLIDFGSGDLLKSSSYTDLVGTASYVAPEVFQRKYHAEPTTVWSLGILMFVMMFESYPNDNDLTRMNSKMWFNNMVSKECCDLISCLLQYEPMKRLRLKKILNHAWFKNKGQTAAGGS